MPDSTGVSLSRIAGALARYRGNESKTSIRIREDNLKRFRTFVRYAYERSSYYAGLIDAHAIDVDACVPEDFPPLTKHVAMSRFDEILTDSRLSRKRVDALVESRRDSSVPYDDEFLIMVSSGTSGGSGVFPITKADALEASLVSYRFYTGQMQKRRAYIFKKGQWGSTALSIGLERIVPSGRPETLFIDQMTATSEIVAELNRFQPSFLCTYASTLVLLGDEQRLGRLRISPVDVQCGGEALSSREHAWLTDVFRCNVVNMYGSTEMLYMGWCSSSMRAMRLLEDNLIFEMHDGFLYCTNLFNRTMPLIRYRVDDAVAVANRGGPFLEVDMQITRNDRAAVLRTDAGGQVALSESWLRGLWAPYVIGAQIALLDDFSFECHVQLSESAESSQRARALDNLRQYLDGELRRLGCTRLRYTIRSVERLVRHNSGKTPPVLDLRREQ